MTTLSKDATPAAQPAQSDVDLRTVLSNRERPKRPGPVSVSLTFGWRAMLRIKHVPEQLFDVTAFPIMFTLIFTYLFGGALAGSPTEYLQFLLPGILVQTVVFITMYTGVALNTDITKGFFDRIRTLPIWRPSAIVGALLGDAARYAMASTMVVGLGLILGFRPAGGFVGVVLAVLVLLVFCFSLSWLWTLLGMVLRTPQSVMGVSSMALFPLTFASNIFVETSTMPGWLQAFVQINPVTHLTSAARLLMSGQDAWSEVIWILIASAVLTAIFAPLTMWKYRTKS